MTRGPLPEFATIHELEFDIVPEVTRLAMSAIGDTGAPPPVSLTASRTPLATQITVPGGRCPVPHRGAGERP